MTLWRNESNDTVKIQFDVGSGKRELISLSPGAEIELPNKLDRYIPREAPQLKIAEPKEEIVPVELPKKKPGRKPKDANGLA